MTGSRHKNSTCDTRKEFGTQHFFYFLQRNGLQDRREKITSGLQNEAIFRSTVLQQTWPLSATSQGNGAQKQRRTTMTRTMRTGHVGLVRPPGANSNRDLRGPTGLFQHVAWKTEGRTLFCCKCRIIHRLALGSTSMGEGTTSRPGGGLVRKKKI